MVALSAKRRSRAVGAAARVGACLACLACLARCSKRPTPPAANADVAPAPPPDGLIASFELPGADAAWSRAQRGVGGVIGVLPSTLGGMLCAATGLDATFAPEIDGRAPAYGAVVDEAGATDFAFAVELVDARRARTKLTVGEASAFSARDVAPGVVALDPRAGAAPLDFALALVDGALVVARRAASAARVGPYLVRTLGARPLAAEDARAAIVVDAPHAALAGPLRARAARAWDGWRGELAAEDLRDRAKRGRAPDFGDPRAVLGALDAFVQARLAALADLTSAHATLGVTDDALDLRVALAPTPDGAAAALFEAMTTGDAAALRDAPSDAIATLLLRDDDASRRGGARNLAAGLVDVLGPRLPAAQAKQIGDAFDAWGATRGEWLTLSVVGAPPALLMRTPARDGESSSRAVRGLVDLATIDAMRAPLENALHVRAKAIAATPATAATGRAEVMSFVRHVEGPGAAAAAPLEIAWLAEHGELRVAFGERPAENALAPPLHALAGAHLPIDLASIADASAVLVVQPLAVFAPGAGALSAGARTAPAVIAWGRNAGGAQLHVGVSDPLLREAIRLLGP